MKNTMSSVSNNKIEPINEIITVTPRNSAVDKRWKSSNSIVNRIRKVSFQPESILPMDDVEAKYKDQRSNESDSTYIYLYYHINYLF